MRKFQSNENLVWSKKCFINICFSIILIILQKEQFISPMGPHGLFSYLSAFWRCLISADAYLCNKWSNVRLTSNFLTSSLGPTNALRMLQRLKRPISPRHLWQIRTHCCPFVSCRFRTSWSIWKNVEKLADGITSDASLAITALLASSCENAEKSIAHCTWYREGGFSQITAHCSILDVPK